MSITADVNTCHHKAPLAPFTKDVKRMRSVCVPFSLRPLHPPSHLLCLWHTCTFRLLLFFFFFFPLPRCYVVINLLLGTWRPPAPRGDLRDFVCNLSPPHFLSHIQNGHLYLYPALATERDCIPAFASPIPGYCLVEESYQIPASRHQLAALILRRKISLFFFPLPLAFRVPEVRVNVVIIPKSTCVYLFVCAKREKEKPLKHFKKHQAQSVLICSGTLRNWAHCLARWQSGKPLTSVVPCRYSLFVHLPAF